MAIRRSAVWDLAQVALFVALIAVLGKPTAIAIGTTSVPVTLQPFAVMLTGSILGARRGFMAVAIFELLTTLGLPLLAGGRGGPSIWTGPSAGYLIGFLVGVLVIGGLTSLMLPRYSLLWGTLFNFLGGAPVIYFCGAVGVMIRRLGPSWPTIQAAGKVTLDSIQTNLPADIVKAVAAALVAKLVHSIARRTRERSERTSSTRAEELSLHGNDLLAEYRRTGQLACLTASVKAFRNAIEISTAQSSDVAATRFMLCIALRELYDQTKDVNALREAVEIGRAAASEMPTDRIGYLTGAVNLALAIRELAAVTRDVDMVNAAVRWGRWAIRAVSGDSPLRADAFSDLSAALYLHYELTDSVDSLEEACNVGRQTLELTPIGHQQYLTGFYDQAKRLDTLYRCTKKPQTLDEAVRVARQGLRLSASDPHQADHARMLANLLRKVDRDRHNRPALEEAISLLRPFVTQSPLKARNQVMLLISLSAALVSLGEETKDLSPLQEGVGWLRQAAGIATGDPGAVDIVNKSLFSALQAVVRLDGSAEAARECVALCRQVLLTAAADSTKHAEWSGSLGLSLTHLGDILEDPSLNMEAVPHLRKAARAVTGDELVLVRYCLWQDLRIQYNRSGGLELLREALDHLRSIIAETRSGDTLLGEYLFSLGSTLTVLYNETSEGPILDEGVKAMRAAIALAPPGDTVEAGKRQRVLAVALVAVADRDDDDGALDEGVALLRQAVAVAVDGDLDPGPSLSNLAAALSAKFERNGDETTLAEAIDFGRRAVERKPHDPTALSNLAEALRKLYNLFGYVAAAHEAVGLLQRAAESVVGGHPNACNVLLNTSFAMRGLADRLRDDELEARSLDMARRAVQHAPPGHHSRAAALNNLGIILTDQYSSSQSDADLQEAWTVLHEARALAPVHERGIMSFNLARVSYAMGMRSRREREFVDAADGYQEAVHLLTASGKMALAAERLGSVLQDLVTHFDRKDLRESALAAYAVAEGAAHSSPAVRMHAARGRAELLCSAGRWTEALAEYSTAIQLIPMIAPRQQGHGDQQHQLQTLTGLACDAAACAVEAGSASTAVELLEHGRGVVLAQQLDFRTDLAGLRQREPTLATRYEVLRDEFASVGAMVPRATTGAATDTDEGPELVRAEQQHNLGARWDALLAEIRDVPGFERFLRSPTFSDLAEASSEGPVVIINISNYRSDALVLSERRVEVVPLVGLGPDTVAGHAKGLLAAIAKDVPPWAVTGLLETLWDQVVEPVLRHLKITARPAARIGPRVWWCPTGMMSFLPLHAAGVRGPSREPAQAIDMVVSSYTPTLRALIEARATRAARSTGQLTALIVAMAETPGAEALPEADREADVIAGKLPGATVVRGPQALHDVVKKALISHSIAHFACHGESDWSDPSSSHLLLHDYKTEPFTVADIASADIEVAELAFLSACRTAQTAPTLVDESLHIASACQLAGFPQVIGTLWNVYDEVSVDIVDSFYEEYLRSRPKESAAAALHLATRKARDRDPHEPLVWASHIHVGC